MLLRIFILLSLIHPSRLSPKQLFGAAHERMARGLHVPLLRRDHTGRMFGRLVLRVAFEQPKLDRRLRAQNLGLDPLEPRGVLGLLTNRLCKSIPRLK